MPNTTPPPVALITGAGSGIGRAVAADLARRGWRLALAGRTLTKLEDSASLCSKYHADPPLLLALNLTDPAASRAAVADTLARFGRIDAIAHVAGSAPNLPIEKVTDEIWRQCIDTNLSAAVHLTAAAWPAFRAQNAGVIVNVSSMAAEDPFPGFAIYAAAKIGLNMFTRCTADEGKAIGVRAVAVAPGAVETPMLRALFSHQALPAHKTLTPEAVAKVICDCITGDRPFDSGQTLLLPSP